MERDIYIYKRERDEKEEKIGREKLILRFK